MGTRSIGGRTRGGLFAFMDVTSLPGGEVMNRKKLPIHRMSNRGYRIIDAGELRQRRGNGKQSASDKVGLAK